MSKISVKESKHSITHEDVLKEKIEDLESNMVFLLNQLIEEKRKLNEVLQAKNTEVDGSLNQDPNNSADNLNENQVHNQTENNTSERVKHLPTCPYSRIILEVDPNCILHGHIYNNSNTFNPNLLLTNFSAKSSNILSNTEMNDSNAAGGDVINKDKSANYIKLLNSFVPGDYTSEAREMLAYHLQRISNIGSETAIDKVQKVDQDINIIHDVTMNNSNNEMSAMNIVELQTIDNSETSLTNELDSSSKTLLELKEKYLKKNSLNNLNDNNNNNDNNITDKCLEYKDIPLNSAYLENELDELNASMMEQGELDILLKALKMSYYGSFLEDIPINLLGELLEKNK